MSLGSCSDVRSRSRSCAHAYAEHALPGEAKGIDAQVVVALTSEDSGALPRRLTRIDCAAIARLV
jgi:hypothetical protein